MSKLAINNGFEHTHTKINGKNTSARVFKRALTERSTICEEQGVVLFRKYHRIWPFEILTIEVFDDRGDLNPVVIDSLTQDSLMRLVCDE